MNQQIPFLEQLKQELLEHAPPQEVGHRPLRKEIRLQGAWAAAAAFIVVFVVGGLTWVVAGDLTPTTTADETVNQQGPELTWRQVPAPEGVSRVRDLWSYSGGLAIWTGEEIWTSSDAENWELVASGPPITNTNLENAVAYADNRWLVAGADENGAPITASGGGSSWTTSALSTPSLTNGLLTNRTEIVGVASGPGGFVAVGAVSRGIDQQAIIERYAPGLSGGEIRYGDDALEILEPDGTVSISVPYEDIDDRLAVHRGVILDTIIWRSPDGQSWNQVDLIEDSGPGYLGAHSNGYALTLIQRVSPEQETSPGTPVLASDNGVDWEMLTELQEPVSATASFGVFEQIVIVGGPDASLLRIAPDGTTRPASTGPAFEGTDLGDLTIAQVAADEYGVLTAAYNHSIGDIPYQALWYSPDGLRWNRQNTSDIFGGDVNLQAAVGSDHVVVAAESEGEAGTALNAPFDLWIGTISK